MLRQIFKPDTTYINRLNTNQNVYQTASEQLEAEDKQKRSQPPRSIHKTSK